MRSTLVAALVSSVDGSLRSKARRFLVGLSSDELEFIADFLGACILESSETCRRSRAELAQRMAEFQHTRAARIRVEADDQEHKMILLLEYLRRTAVREFSVSMRAAQL